jgi:putative transposase
MPGPDALRLGVYYHFFNRGDNKGNIFFDEGNYDYFLKLHGKYIGSIADSYVYSLLPNQFHFAVRVKTEAEHPEDMKSPRDLPGRSLKNPSQQFGNFFNAYSKTINRRYARTGSLFQKPFSRIAIQSEPHLLRLITYVHQNPQRHGLTLSFRDWPYYSTRVFLSSGKTRIKKQEVINRHGGLRGFMDFHREFFKRDDLEKLVRMDE